MTLAIKRCENKQNRFLPGQHFVTLSPKRLLQSKQPVEKMLSRWAVRVLLAACVCANFAQATHSTNKGHHHDEDLVTPAPQLAPMMKLARERLEAFPSQYHKKTFMKSE
jgi:negative regulator of sigma E activity